MNNKIDNQHSTRNAETRLMQALNCSLDILIQAVSFIALQNGAAFKQSPDMGEYLFKANTIPELPIVQEETQVSNSGITYISKRIYEDAYWRVTIYFDEWGTETKRDNKRL